jgi:DNA mismatch endonuclease (patch repair protein)
MRYRKNVRELPGVPDIVLSKAKLVVFVDGDFWHGRNWEAREAKLRRGANAGYWLAKIASNMARDRLRTAELEMAGWTVVRVWETDVLRDAAAIAEGIRMAVAAPMRPPAP